MNPVIRRVFVALLVAAGAACVSTTQQGSGTRSSTVMISTEEIREASATNAFDLVQSLRPAWLRTRGATSIYNEVPVQVYYDQVRMGGPEVLRTIPTSSITTMHFLDAASATQRWGTGHTHGAILVTTGTSRRN